MGRSKVIYFFFVFTSNRTMLLEFANSLHFTIQGVNLAFLPLSGDDVDDDGGADEGGDGV